MRGKPQSDLVLAGYAAMQTIKSMMPLQLDKYDALFRFQTKDFSVSEVALAQEVAAPVVFSLLSSRYHPFLAEHTIMTSESNAHCLCTSS